MFCINTFTFVFSLLWHWLMPEQCWSHWRVWVRLDPCGTVIILSGGSSWEAVVFFFSLRRVESSEIATRDEHTSSLGIAVCWRRPLGWILGFEAITSPSFINPHSFRSQQSTLGFADCTHFFAVKEGHEYPPVLWLKSLCSWSNHDCGGYGLVPPSHLLYPFFFLSTRSSFQSLLLASYLCTVWLADPNVLCVLEPDSKKIGLLQHQGTYRRTAKGLWGKKEQWKTGSDGELEAWAQC